MKPFLEELATRILQEYTDLESLTLVFPNRRAALFFRKFLSEQLRTPVWSPKLITIEELFKELATLQEADRLSLIFRLYRVYSDVIKKDESFDRFYFWGDMLLRDFDEIDKYVAPASRLFMDLSRWRELDPTFDTLTEEQKKFLKDFWTSFGDKPVTSKEEFLRVWRHLPNVYAKFVQSLRKDGIGYEGMLHREVAEKISAGKLVLKAKKNAKAMSFSPDRMIFAGFNALTTAEETLLAHFVEKGAKIIWDSDPWYVDDKIQEAGLFFRQYRKHPVLGATFEPTPHSNFKSGERQVHLYGVPQKAGQAKLLGELLDKQIIPAIAASGVEGAEAKTVVVLPDESLLLSVLHSIPESLSSVNVTMGYPLRSTPVYNLIELLIELQTHRRPNGFSHRQVTAILAHPYVLAQAETFAVNLRLDIIRKNRIYIPAEDLNSGNELLALVFKPVDAVDITRYLLQIIKLVGSNFSDDQGFDREYAFHFYTTLARFADILKDSGSDLDLRGFQKLFRQVIQSQKIPFTGEPLQGLQVMGVLETRNLDFDNVFILSLNEGALPAAARQGSYIPHAIRKAYALPTHDHQDAMYAYLFYRVLQRAKNIHLIYNTEPDILGMGEMSRFVQQLVYESGWKINHHILSNPIQLNDVHPINVAKTPNVLEHLANYTHPDNKGISPTALNDYIECTLRFYLKHIARLQEAEEVEEELDARIFGNFLHDVMDWFYHDLMEEKKSKTIEAVDLDQRKVKAKIEQLIDKAFHKHYSIPDEKEIEYVGQRVVVRAIVMQFALQIIKQDNRYAPFYIELLEAKKFRAPLTIDVGNNKSDVIIGGRIDRVDSKENVVRIIDYKTGSDEIRFKSVAALFAREGKRNKSAFQTLLYSWLYDQNIKPTGAIRPMLMNRKNLFDEELHYFKMDSREILDVKPDLGEFETLLKGLITEMFNPTIEFSQTPEEKNCRYCDFRNMCRR